MYDYAMSAVFVGNKYFLLFTVYCKFSLWGTFTHTSSLKSCGFLFYFRLDVSFGFLLIPGLNVFK